ncbi:hypothetical protein [Massilia atriviolacea]|nr:hypothetical protein [Massilia atriviolacea]
MHAISGHIDWRYFAFHHLAIRPAGEPGRPGREAERNWRDAR